MVELDSLNQAAKMAATKQEKTMIEQIEETLEAYGVTLSAVFVPASVFADDEWRGKSINHNVTLIRGNSRITTDYSQGIGHHPHYKAFDRSVDHHNAMQRSIEDGRAHRSGRGFGLPKPLPAPLLRDVLCSLLMDSNHDLNDFSDWCAECGYENDSIKARQTFDACRKLKLAMLAMFSHAELDELNVLFEDY